MSYRIEHKLSFDVIGIKSSRVLKPFDQEMGFMWQKAMENGDFDRILRLANTDFEGIHGFCSPAENGFEYYIASVSTLEPPEGLSKLNIPESTWFIYAGQGRLPEDLHKAWADAFQELQSSEYQQIAEPCFERYLKFEEDLTSQFELWIAVEKKYN